MSYPEDLLEQARHLAQRERKRPKQASLRRAVSSAYYALFHLLIAETVKNWRRPTERNTLARMFDHGQMSKVCSNKRQTLHAYFQSKPAQGRVWDVAKHLHNVTDTFTKMLQDRHTADYDHSVRWTRVQTLERIEMVAGAFASWKAIREEHDAQDFLVTLLLRERRP